MNKTIKEQLDKMENHLNEALDNDLFNDPEFDMDEFQSEVCSFESELNELLEFNREHLQFPELEKICSVQKKIKQVKDEYEFYASFILWIIEFILILGTDNLLLGIFQIIKQIV